MVQTGGLTNDTTEASVVLFNGLILLYFVHPDTHPLPVSHPSPSLLHPDAHPRPLPASHSLTPASPREGKREGGREGRRAGGREGGREGRKEGGRSKAVFVRLERGRAESRAVRGGVK